MRWKISARQIPCHTLYDKCAAFILMTVGLPPGRGGRAVRCIDGVPAMNHKNTGGTIMSALNELIEQIENPELRKRIADEVNKLAKQKKFGLVFEEHQPECTLLYDVPVRKGAKVTLRDAKNITDIYTVLKLENGKALCLKEGAGARRSNLPQTAL